MTTKDDMKDMLAVIRRDQAALQLLAELDPAGLRAAAGKLAGDFGVEAAIVVRVIEDELGMKPLPVRDASPMRPTRIDVPAVSD
ncbi:MAG: hypothetical protein AB1Z98_02335 [Nannocystaceae bacterium]